MTSENRYVLYFQVKGTCPYLSNNHSTMMNLLIFQDEVDSRLYSALISNGWRRHGKEIYRMECPGCKLCIPLRIKAESIQLTLSLNRILKKNNDIIIISNPPEFDEEHFRLWQRYSIWKHSIPLNDLKEDSYKNLLEPWSLIFEYRDNSKGRKLLAVSHVDPLDDGLSSVYFSFEPDARGRSLGFFSILAESYLSSFAKKAKHLLLNKEIKGESVSHFYENRIQHKLGRDDAKSQAADNDSEDKRYYYLGFWVPGASKMDYKARISPFEIAIADENIDDPNPWKRFLSEKEAIAYLSKQKWQGLSLTIP